MSRASRYCVGIDLGTTNSVVAFVDTVVADPSAESSRIFPVRQTIGPGVAHALPLLPSALLFEPAAGADSSAPDWIVGRWAAEQARYQPQRVVQSSKSWLTHSAVNREAAILPWGSTEVPPERQLSPLDAARCILEQICAAWNAEFCPTDPAAALEQQEVVITVPASFDEVAQQLTLRAAHAAGLRSVRLLEEPQSAFYRWLELHRRELRQLPLRGPITVLVCDVGGGTTDLSLFEVVPPPAAESSLELPHATRLAVSEHLLLGGDNIDALVAEQLAHQLEHRQGGAPSFSQRLTLRAVSRDLKERALSDAPDLPAQLSVTVPGAGGSGLFGAAAQVSVALEPLRATILEGFFPLCAQHEQPRVARAGLREQGLPYAHDARITAHIAAFLRGRRVSALLCNGGTLASALVRNRIRQCLAQWQGDAVVELTNTDLDTAVARGAAWAAYMQRCQGRAVIRAGYPRSLYVELFRAKRSDPARLLCSVPKGFEGGAPLVVSAPNLAALVERPVRFQVWSSLHRPQDQAGNVIEDLGEDLQPGPQIVTKLELPAQHALGKESRVPIQIEANLSETGLLTLQCRAEIPMRAGGVRPTVWSLSFAVRSAGAGEVDVLPAGAESPGGAPDPDQELGLSGAQRAALQSAREVIDRYYGRRKESESVGSPKSLFKQLEQQLRGSREDWSLTQLRALWPALERGVTRRGRSLEHEVTWLNLAGFLLRPGFGSALDGVRIDQAWRVQVHGLSFPKEVAVNTAACIFWRRIAAGLSAERQEQLFQGWVRRLDAPPSYAPELLRMLATLERVGVPQKVSLLRRVLKWASSPRTHPFGSALAWALERLVTRVPLCGDLDAVVPGHEVGAVLAELVQSTDVRRGLPNLNKAELQAVLLSAAAATGDPRRDLDAELRSGVQSALRALGASAAVIADLERVVEVQPQKIARLLGEQLPAGLSA
jgi:molecular chaperone DnaK (HSP70)